MPDPGRLQRAYQTARRDLLAERHASGHWVGELSSSSLSTATATSALALVRRHAIGPPCGPEVLDGLVERGVECLARAQNADGGWGDTDKSLSNVATTMLARAAIVLAGAAGRHAGLLARAEEYLSARGGISALKARYGKDKTFAVPILTNCALAGLVPWAEVAPLPFELASLPNKLLGLLRLPVVSYAIPALVAIGQARYFHARPRNPIARLVRRLAIPSGLRTLERMQPASGGFLEATPLTSFVVMSLAGTGRADHPVARRGVEFLARSVRPDGSWPIDTNLATWTTTLAINALAAGPSSAADAAWGEPEDDLAACLDWLLSCQHQQVHPLSSAAPGGWGWTDLSGAVPDADDTSGALLALAAMRRRAHAEACRRIDAAAQAGLQWLLRLQNADGGWPTFCRGWGNLPFDRTGVDLTAHALRAIVAWQGMMPGMSRPTVALQAARRAMGRGLDYLVRVQQPDGSWLPLWFGNQHRPDESNPVYGTARAVLAYRDLGLTASEPARRGVAWLAGQADAEGGWGGEPSEGVGQAPGLSSTEQTAVAVEALLAAEPQQTVQSVLEQGLSWLVRAVESRRYREASPIGLYFARLWYYERLYPLCFTVSALGRAAHPKQPPGQPRTIPPESSSRTVPETAG